MPSSSIPPSGGKLRQEHFLFCFDIINEQLNGTGKAGTSAAELPSADEEFPLFVTWNTVHGTTGTTRLRGCIGTFEPLPLREGLAEYSATAAFRDRRFRPITQAELPKLECAISLLTQFEECNDYLDWEIGVHGIYIDFDPLPSQANGGGAVRRRSGARGRYSATYLPDVMPEQGWTKEEAIDSAIEKSGYAGPITEQLRRALHVRRYQSEKASLRYPEWKALRNAPS